MAQVIFSAKGENHDSDGNPDLMTYMPGGLNVGGGWNDSSTFKAPEKGFYFFSITCVRNAINTGGTEDDVRILLRRNGTDVGFAWCGQGSGARSTGAYSVAVKLNQNDRIETFADSDGGRRRVFGIYQFSGFLIR